MESTSIQDDLVGWLVFIMFGLLLSMSIQANIASQSTDKNNSFQFLTNPASIFGAISGATEEVVKSSFGEISSLLNVLVQTAGIIGDSLDSIRNIVRQFFVMINGFASIAQQQIQGLINAVISLSQSMKRIFTSMMSMFTILIYTLMTGLNLSSSVMNGPPGQAMRAMESIVRAF